MSITFENGDSHNLFSVTDHRLLVISSSLLKAAEKKLELGNGLIPFRDHS